MLSAVCCVCMGVRNFACACLSRSVSALAQGFSPLLCFDVFQALGGKQQRPRPALRLLSTADRLPCKPQRTPYLGPGVTTGVAVGSWFVCLLLLPACCGRAGIGGIRHACGSHLQVPVASSVVSFSPATAVELQLLIAPASSLRVVRSLRSQRVICYRALHVQSLACS